MGRKSPNYHVDTVDKRSVRSESYRPGSVSSSDISVASSLNKKSNAPKIVAAVIVSLAIVAILIGVTFYLIDNEKAKLKEERVGERYENGAETEMDFGENAKAYISDESTEQVLDLSGKSDIYQSLSENRKLTAEQLNQLKQISQRRRFLENFHKSKQEEFLRPTEEEREIISSLISNRKPNIAHLGHHGRRKPVGQDLEFGGVGLFGPKHHHQTFTAVPDNDEVTEQDDDEDKTDEPNLRNPVNYRDDADPRHGDIYDMTSYMAQDQDQMIKNRPVMPRRRNRNKLLRLGLEGFRRNEPVEVNVDESRVVESVESEPSVAAEESEEPVLGLKRPGQHMAEQGPSPQSLATIDRRPGRPGFHWNGPARMRPFPRRRHPAAGLNKPGNLDPRVDQLATESFQRKMLIEMSERKQDEILSNFDSFLKIAGSELGFLRSVAKNITQSGREVNLWEVLTAVNETVRKNPDSSIAQLMTKFEVRE